MDLFGYNLEALVLWQWSQLLSVANFIHALVGMILIIVPSSIILVNFTYANTPNSDLPTILRNRLPKFFLYIPWALVQHIVVVALVGAAGLHSVVAVVFALFIFSLFYHWGNWLLTIITLVMGSYLYIPYYLFEFQSLIYMAAMHAFAAVMLKTIGVSLKTGWYYLFGEGHINFHY